MSNSPPAPSSPATPSPYARFTGLAEWRSALLALLQQPAAEKRPPLICCDSDFSLWRQEIFGRVRELEPPSPYFHYRGWALPPY